MRPSGKISRTHFADLLTQSLFRFFDFDLNKIPYIFDAQINLWLVFIHIFYRVIHNVMHHSLNLRVKDVGDFVQIEIEDNGKGIA